MCTPTFLHNTEFAHSLLEILQSHQIHKQELFPDRSLLWQKCFLFACKLINNVHKHICTA